MAELTTFQKMDELEKRLFISRLVNLCNADEKAFTVMQYQMEQQELRLKEAHIPIATNFPTMTIP
jgi:hypothetical protein